MVDEDIKKKIRSVFAALDELDLTNEVWKTLSSYLKIVYDHDKPTYQHCLRVAALCVIVARFLNLDQKPLLYAGVLHDFGKIKISRDILNKVEGFSKEDFGKVKKHTLVGYFILKNVFPFSAEILLRHHQFQKDSYPKKLPKSTYNLQERQLINKYARILALVDFYDALKTRANEFLKGELPPPRELLKKYMIESNSDQKELIDQLFLMEIF